MAATYITGVPGAPGYIPAPTQTSTNTSTESYSNPYALAAAQQLMAQAAIQNAALRQQTQHGYDVQQVQAGQRYDALTAQAMAQANQLGETQKQQIHNAYLQSLGAQSQGLMSRGLGNTTVVNSVGTGLLQNEQLNQTAAAEAACNSG